MRPSGLGSEIKKWGRGQMKGGKKMRNYRHPDPRVTPADEGFMAAKRDNASVSSRASCNIRIDITQHLGPEMSFDNIEAAVRKGLENYGYRVNEVKF